MSEKTTGIIRIVVSVVAILACVVYVQYGTQEIGKVQDHQRKLENSIIEAETQQNLVNDQPGTGTVIIEQRQVWALADQVADLQNQFSSIILQTESTGGDGALSVGDQQSVEHRRSLEPFWAAGSLILDEDTIYRPSTAPLSIINIDPRLPWYTRFDATEPFRSYSPSQSWSWKTVSVLPYSNDTIYSHVLWLARDTNDGQLLAWATADFNHDKDQFQSLSVGETQTGHDQGSNGDGGRKP